jgi:hypothetical protein
MKEVEENEPVIPTPWFHRRGVPGAKFPAHPLFWSRRSRLIVVLPEGRGPLMNGLFATVAVRPIVEETTA